MKIHVVTTGGTIEKIYSEQTGQVENLTARAWTAICISFAFPMRWST